MEKQVLPPTQVQSKEGTWPEKGFPQLCCQTPPQSCDEQATSPTPAVAEMNLGPACCSGGPRSSAGCRPAWQNVCPVASLQT